MTSVGRHDPADPTPDSPRQPPYHRPAAAGPVPPGTPRRPGSGRAMPSHTHLWYSPDGTGLHAPHGELVVEAGTGRVCCHLCGHWFMSLGGHLRKHGHTAESYRRAMGLCRTRRLVAEYLSRSIAARQTRAYQRSPALRAQLAGGQQLSRTGRLARLARTARDATTSPELVRIRREALAAGRATSAARREEALSRRLHELGADNLADYLRDAYAAGASLRRLAAMTGLGWSRLRREVDAAGIVLRSTRAPSAGSVHRRRSGTG